MNLVNVSVNLERRARALAWVWKTSSFHDLAEKRRCKLVPYEIEYKFEHVRTVFALELPQMIRMSFEASVAH